MKALCIMIFLATAAPVFGGCADHTEEAGRTPRAASLLDQLVPILWPAARVLLRTPTREDLPGLLPIYQDWETVQYTWFSFKEGKPVWTLDSLRERFEWQAGEQLKGLRYDFVIENYDEPRAIIGRCALYRPEEHGDWEFGITLNKKFWRQGYGEAASRAAFDFAFGYLRAENVFLEILPENAAMQTLAKRMGLRLHLSAKDAKPAGKDKLHYDYYAIDRPIKN